MSRPGRGVPTEDVRAHLRSILEQPAFSIHDVTAASGVSIKTLKAILDPAKSRPSVYPSTAAPILSLTERDVANARRKNLQKGKDLRCVDSAATRRRVEVLLANGHGVSELSRLTGLSRSTFAPSNMKSSIYMDTALRVQAAYGMLMNVEGEGKLVSACSSRRLVEALQALGWRNEDILTTANVGKSTLGRPVTGKITLGSARAIRSAFEELKYKNGPSPITATRARLHGYAPWPSWGDEGEMDRLEGKPDLSWIRDTKWREAVARRYGLTAPLTR